MKKIAADTMVGGATLTKLLGTPHGIHRAQQAHLVEAIVRDESKYCLAACTWMVNRPIDICLGVPVIVGRNGWEKIIDHKFNDEGQEQIDKSAEAVRSMNSVLATLAI